MGVKICCGLETAVDRVAREMAASTGRSTGTIITLIAQSTTILQNQINNLAEDLSAWQPDLINGGIMPKNIATSAGLWQVDMINGGIMPKNIATSAGLWQTDAYWAVDSSTTGVKPKL